ncbi:MAG: hypothetical protein EHM65_05715 [Acidobacteriales bacterium]|nr:MAG: hypothetical protein EHM65_05715 [Terriglobales bacterium]
MAVRVIIDYSAPAGRNGDAYYRMFPREPSVKPEWDMQFDPDEIVRIEGMTLLKLLEAMAAAPVPDAVVVLTHGTVEGENDGMVMPIGSGFRGQRAASATNAALQAITDCERNLNTVKDVAEQVLKVSKATLESILSLRREIQGRIERLEFRACNLGKLDYVLAGLREFFGAGYALAPRNFMLYSRVDPVVGFQESTFQQWVEINQGPAVSAIYEGSDAPAGRRFQDTFLSTEICNTAPDPSGRGELCVPVSGSGPPADSFFLKIWEAAREPRQEWEISAAARSSADVRPWIDQNICPESGYSGGPFYIEAIWTSGVLDRPYVLPMDPGYREMIGCSPYA